MPINNFDGPIPGENYTSDTKNYPWHRPPEFTELDDAIEASFQRLTSDDNAVGLLTMLENGVSIVDAASIFLKSGMGAGKWTPDFALLLAGPVAHIMYLMAVGYGIEPDIGLSKRSPRMTKAFFDRTIDINEGKVKRVMKGIDVEAIKAEAESRGFMSFGAQGPAPSAVQDEMLGYSDDQMEDFIEGDDVELSEDEFED